MLEDIWFRGAFPTESQIETFGQPKINKMENVSFENADLHYLAFSDGCDLSTAKLKNNGRYFKYDNWLERIRFLEEEIGKWEDQDQKKEASRFVRVYKVHTPKQKWAIFNLDDLEKSYGIEAAHKIIDILNSTSVALKVE